MQDVLPPNNNNRSIRNIPVSKRHQQHEVEAVHENLHEDPYYEETPEPPRRQRRGHSSVWMWGGAIVLGCVLAGMLISTLFAGATISVYPRQVSVKTPLSLPAQLDAANASALPYEKMTVPTSAQRTVTATGVKNVTQSAQGPITISNTYNTQPQKLVANTRFESPDGLIYRIHQAVTVPGAKKNIDGTLTPGTVQATVFADAAGPDYNKSNVTLTIPGFKNDPRYTKFSATAASISGGAKGTQPAIAQNDLAKAVSDMKQEIASKLPDVAGGKVPDGYFAVPGTFDVSYGEPTSQLQSSNQAVVTLSATATEAIVRSDDLAQAIARNQVDAYNGEAVTLTDPSAVKLSVASGSPYKASSNSFTVSVDGTIGLVWKYDPNQVAAALAGKDRAQFDAIMSSFAPAIAKGTSASLRPFWKSTFPSNPSDIKVKTEN